MADRKEFATYEDLFFAKAVDALQFLDEIGGPEPRDYMAVMERVAAHCKECAHNCRTNFAEKMSQDDDIEWMRARGFSWEYPGFYNKEISGGIQVTVGYDNGPKRFCVQLVDDEGTPQDWPHEISDEAGDCDTREEVAALVDALDRAFMSPQARNDIERKENPK